MPGRRHEQLLQRARSGDSIAFAHLFDLHAGRIYEYMFFNVGDVQAAEDLTARVFLKAWRGIPCLEPQPTPFGVWVYLLARSAILDYRRSRHEEAALKEIVSPADHGLAESVTPEPCSE